MYVHGFNSHKFISPPLSALLNVVYGFLILLGRVALVHNAIYYRATELFCC